MKKKRLNKTTNLNRQQHEELVNQANVSIQSIKTKKRINATRKYYERIQSYAKIRHYR